MRRSIAAVDWTGPAVCAVVLLTVASLSARPSAAQGFGYAAVAVSPSTDWAGAEKGTTSQASVENGALQYCADKGARDCRVLSAVNGCVALAEAATPVPNQFGLASAPTRDGAAANAVSACTKMGGITCVANLAPCGSDDVRFPSPLPLPPGGKPGSVDPALVGLWGLNVNGGIWVWQISANGTYTFHSEAPGNVQPHAGTFTASSGKYTLHSLVSPWDDLGTYAMQGTTAVSMTGKLGTGTWVRIKSDPDYSASGSTPAPGITIRR